MSTWKSSKYLLLRSPQCLMVYIGFLLGSFKEEICLEVQKLKPLNRYKMISIARMIERKIDTDNSDQNFPILARTGWLPRVHFTRKAYVKRAAIDHIDTPVSRNSQPPNLQPEP